jgi:hypothetical protein
MHINGKFLKLILSSDRSYEHHLDKKMVLSNLYINPVGHPVQGSFIAFIEAI